MKKRCVLRLASLLLAAVLALGALPAAQAAFPDVEESQWYSGYVTTLTQMGLLSGYTDGTFKPNASLSRGEFAKLVDSCFGNDAPREGDRHWAAGHVDNLTHMGVLLPGEFPDGKEALDEPITRYEMAAMLVRASDLRGDLSFISFDGALVFSDWSTIPQEYAQSVVQAYSRGLLGGYPDGSFSGLNGLTRAEACAVVARLLFPFERLTARIPGYEEVPLWLGQISYVEVGAAEPLPELPSAVQLPELPEQTLPPVLGSGEETLPALPEEVLPQVSPMPSPELPSVQLPEESLPELPQADMFAPVQTAVGFMSSQEQRQLIFGDSSKTAFASQEEAESCMEKITVRVWRKDSQGIKRETQVELTVHKAVASDLQGIFELIFNGPQQYCMQSIGGYSWTSMRSSEHNCGTAIDINPFANPYVNSSGEILVGDYYDPEDEYSITADSDVYKAFAAYGWGWGGSGEWSSGALDYMHFSLRGT